MSDDVNELAMWMHSTFMRTSNCKDGWDSQSEGQRIKYRRVAKELIENPPHVLVNAALRAESERQPMIA